MSGKNSYRIERGTACSFIEKKKIKAWTEVCNVASGVRYFLTSAMKLQSPCNHLPNSALLTPNLNFMYRMVAVRENLAIWEKEGKNLGLEKWVKENKMTNSLEKIICIKVENFYMLCDDVNSFTFVSIWLNLKCLKLLFIILYCIKSYEIFSKTVSEYLENLGTFNF